MAKRIFFLIVSLLFVASAVYAGATLRYYNKDSRTHTFDAKSCGSSKKVTFGSSRTASVTIQGCSTATIFTSCGKVEVKDGDRIEIKNGCITVK